jgi:putative ABC transport system permease protein
LGVVVDRLQQRGDVAHREPGDAHRHSRPFDGRRTRVDVVDWLELSLATVRASGHHDDQVPEGASRHAPLTINNRATARVATKRGLPAADGRFEARLSRPLNSGHGLAAPLAVTAVLELVPVAHRVAARRNTRARIEMTAEVARMALRNVARNARRSVLSGAMVAVGVAAVLFAKAYLGGLQVLIQQGVVEAGHGALQVMHAGYASSQEMSPLNLSLPDDPALSQVLRQVENVRATAPRLRFMGMVNGNERTSAFNAIGVVPELEAEVCRWGPAAKTERLVGSRLSGSDANEVILGTELARGLGVELGDTVTLLVHTRSGSMDAVDLTVVATYRFDDLETNKRLVVVPLATAQKLLHLPGRVTSFTVAVDDLRRLDETVAAVRAALKRGPWPTEAHGWPTLQPRFRDLLVIQDAVLGVLLLIVFGLVLAGVVNAMLMSVYERTREIGTLMSMGFSPRRIAGLFLCEALMLGLFASLAGAALGLTLIAYTGARGIPFQVPGVGMVENHPSVALSFAALAVIGAVLGALAGGLWPAWRASRLQPVEALSSH